MTQRATTPSAGSPRSPPASAASWRSPRPRDHAALFQICRGRQPDLQGLAERIEPPARWHDLVLPPAGSATIRQIATQVGLCTVYDAWGFRRWARASAREPA